jgi:hypothetical protein
LAQRPHYVNADVESVVTYTGLHQPIVILWLKFGTGAAVTPQPFLSRREIVDTVLGMPYSDARVRRAIDKVAAASEEGMHLDHGGEEVVQARHSARHARPGLTPRSTGGVPGRAMPAVPEGCWPSCI